MAKESRNLPPKRKEPGIIGRLLSGIFNLLFWLFISLLLSIAIEWVGMTWYWPDEGVNHSQAMLQHEQHYLNQRLQLHSTQHTQWVNDTIQHINQWITYVENNIHRILQQWNNHTYLGGVSRYYQQSTAYIAAVPYVAQVFFIRVSLIIFSLPAFILSGIFGAVDGLIERDLRRWGGGRESSNVYNIARKSTFPIFILACVMYLSLPVSIHPAWVIMPFVIIFGFSIRVSFERLKKYF